MASRACRRQSSFIRGTPKTKGAADCSAAPRSPEENLLQVGDRGQVSRELDDAGRATPVGFEATRVDRRNAASGGNSCSVVAGEGVAGTLGQVGVGVTQVQREHLVGEAEADIPRVIARLRNTLGVVGATGQLSDAVERIRRAEPLTTKLAGDVHANAGGAKGGRGCGPLAGDRSVVAPSAEVQEVRRIVLVDADRELVVQGNKHLAVDFVEACALLGYVAVDRKTVGEGIGISAEQRRSAACFRTGNARTGDRITVEAAAARIQVAPGAEVEGEHADGRPDTAVDVDFSRGAVREGDALAGQADIELGVLVD